jgi:hypothetical protein
MDRHEDVHLPGIWNKALKENTGIMYLQEHSMKFDSVIAKAQDTKVTAKYYDWKELGFNYEGKTQALEFEVEIKREQNPFMFGQFEKGNVNQNSVGMRYVKIDLAINDEDYDNEYALWQKHINSIANKDAVIDNGYFWAVSEAKILEGSAVLMGSNPLTPVFDQDSQPRKSTDLDDTIKIIRESFKNL